MADPQAEDATLEERVIVRRYTDEFSGHSELNRAVRVAPTPAWGSPDSLDKTKLKRLKLQFQESDTNETYWDADKALKQLQTAWSDFQSKLPEPERKKWSLRGKASLTSKGNVDQKLKASEIITFQDVEHAVTQSATQWEKRDHLLGGQIHDRFHKICKSLSSHSGIFALFPLQNEYVSVICGTLKMIVQASETHMETADLFTKAFREALDNVDVIMKYGGIMDDEDMRRRVSTMYGKVFELLRFSMQWWDSSALAKARRSLGSGTYDKLQAYVKDIEGICKFIYNQVEVRRLAESRYTRIVTEDTHRLVQQLGGAVSDIDERVRRFETQLEKFESIPSRMQINTQAFSLFLSIMRSDHCPNLSLTTNELLQQDPSQITTSLIGGTDPAESSHIVGAQRTSDRPHQRNVLLRDDVLLAAHHIEQYICGSPKLITRGSPSTTLDDEMVFRLQEWSTETASQLLWILGPQEDAAYLPSNMLPVAASMTLTAEKLKIPFISHSCQLPNDRQDGREERALVGLVYSLTLQLVKLMPPIIDIFENTFEMDKLKSLDGTMNSWDNAIDILRHFLTYSPWPLLLCVIDGITRLDFRGGSKPCADVADVLVQRFEAKNGKTFKVLLTSSGMAGSNTALGKRINVSNRVHAHSKAQNLGIGRPLDFTRSLSASTQGSQEPLEQT